MAFKLAFGLLAILLAVTSSPFLEIPKKEAKLEMLKGLIPNVSMDHTLQNINCSFSLTIGGSNIPPPFVETLKDFHHQYIIGVSQNMIDFNYDWKSYRGLVNEDQLFSFRTLPPSLASKRWLGHCAVH